MYIFISINIYIYIYMFINLLIYFMYIYMYFLNAAVQHAATFALTPVLPGPSRVLPQLLQLCASFGKREVSPSRLFSWCLDL